MYATTQKLTLTDGSKVYNVLILDNYESEHCKIDCISERAARLLADHINTSASNIEFY